MLIYINCIKILYKIQFPYFLVLPLYIYFHFNPQQPNLVIMKKFIFLALFVPLFAASQTIDSTAVSYIYGMQKLRRMLGKGIRAGSSWDDSAARATRIYLVELMIQPGGSISSCQIISTGQVDSTEVSSILATLKKSEHDWQNKTDHPGAALLQIGFVNQEFGEGVAEAMVKELFQKLNIASYSSWLPVNTFVVPSMTVIIGPTMRESVIKATIARSSER
jgi:hypothetical protein